MSTRRPAIVVLVTLASSAFTAPAAGDEETKAPAAAQVLFDEARTLMQAGRFAEACPKLAESQRLDPGPGTLFHLADCNEHVGKTASAWASFVEVADMARASGRTPHEKLARSRAAALAPKLTRLRVMVPEESAKLPGLDVTDNGAKLGLGTWGTAVPVDPGTHTVSAIAPGYVAFQTQVAVKEEGVTVDVRVPPLVRDARVASGSAPAVAIAPEPPPVAEEGVRPLRVAAVALGGLGLVSLGVGSYFGAQALSGQSDSVGHCQGDFCDPEGVHLRDRAFDQGNVSTVAFIGGGVALAGALVLWLVAPTPNKKASASRALWHEWH